VCIGKTVTSNQVILDFNIYTVIKSYKIFESDNKERRLNQAAIKGDLKEVKKLLNDSDVDIEHYDNSALWYAVAYNRLDVIKELLKDPRIDPTYDKNRAIKLASSNGDDEIVLLLLHDKRVQKSLSKKKLAEFGKLLTADLIVNLNK